MKRPRVKICGITRNSDALLAAKLGADAIGLNFYNKSSRAITIDEVAGIVSGIPAFTSVVGLFVDQEQTFVREVLKTDLIHCLQFHGCESLEYCQSFGVPFIKAIRVSQLSDAMVQVNEFANHCPIILDAYVENVPGGTGQTFDWSIARELVAEYPDKIVLAGGLDPDNVAQAITQVKPYGVDVSSGVEAQPGVKSPDKLRHFFAAVYGASKNP